MSFYPSTYDPADLRIKCQDVTDNAFVPPSRQIYHNWHQDAPEVHDEKSLSATEGDTYLRPRAGIKYPCFYQSDVRDASETQETMQP